jgi:hypothetical protein
VEKPSVNGKNPFYGNKIKAIKAKLEAEERLTPEEKAIWQAHQTGVERYNRRKELLTKDRINRIVEMEVFQHKSPKEIGAELGIRAENVLLYKQNHPELMREAYARVEEAIELQRKARCLDLASEFIDMAESAVGVFRQHLDGEKQGDLNPMVRQRAAEKVLEIVSPPKKEVQRHVHQFDPKALTLIGQRQAALRAKNDVLTTAEVVEDEAQA